MAPDFLSGFLSTFLQINQRNGIVFPQIKLIEILLHSCHFPGLMNMLFGKLAKFSHPFLDKHPLRIVILRLLDGVIHSYRIYSRSPCLHLKLRVMDAGFIVEKLLGQMINPCSPVLIKMETKNGNQHCAHAEIYPAPFQSHIAYRHPQAENPFVPISKLQSKLHFPHVPAIHSPD